LKHILVAGGDKRAVFLAKLLADDGYAVETLGLKTEDENQVHIEQADVVLFPYPHAVKGGWIPNLSGLRLRVEDVLPHIKKEACILAGKGLEGYVQQETQRLMRYTDASDFKEENAELSAEAAACEVMLHSRTMLRHTQILVTGYGLFGRALALKLKALRVLVWTAVRREAQRKEAEKDGMNAILLPELEDILPQMELIVNTVPARIFDEYLLKKIPARCWILETASAPYGFDMDTARTMGVLCALLPGLPAKYAPESAALLMHDAVKELLGRCGI